MGAGGGKRFRSDINPAIDASPSDHGDHVALSPREEIESYDDVVENREKIERKDDELVQLSAEDDMEIMDVEETLKQEHKGNDDRPNSKGRFKDEYNDERPKSKGLLNARVMDEPRPKSKGIKSSNQSNYASDMVSTDEHQNVLISSSPRHSHIETNTKEWSRIDDSDEINGNDLSIISYEAQRKSNGIRSAERKRSAVNTPKNHHESKLDEKEESLRHTTDYEEDSDDDALVATLGDMRDLVSSRTADIQMVSATDGEENDYNTVVNHHDNGRHYSQTESPVQYSSTIYAPLSPEIVSLSTKSSNFEHFDITDSSIDINNSNMSTVTTKPTSTTTITTTSNATSSKKSNMSGVTNIGNNGIAGGSGLTDLHQRVSHKSSSSSTSTGSHGAVQNTSNDQAMHIMHLLDLHDIASNECQANPLSREDGGGDNFSSLNTPVGYSNNSNYPQYTSLVQKIGQESKSLVDLQRQRAMSQLHNLQVN